ncbi:MAG: LamG-like jellyroll fold domain-containing protein [Thermoleophilia bacterium]|jgi:hypothetical protein
MKKPENESQLMLRPRYLAAFALLGALLLVLLWHFGTAEGGDGASGDPAQRVGTTSDITPMYRDADFYGINASLDDITQADVSQLTQEAGYSDDFVLEVKVKITDTSALTATAGIVFSGDDDRTHYKYGIFPNEGRVKLNIAGSESRTLTRYQPEAFKLNQWHALKVSAASGTMHFYVDGVEVTPPEGVAAGPGAESISLRIRNSTAFFDDCKLTDSRTGAVVFDEDFQGGAGDWEPGVSEAWSLEDEGGNAIYRGSVLLGAARLISPQFSPKFVTRLDLLGATGAGSLRVFLDWKDIQPQGPDSFYWDYMDAMFIAAHERHLNIVPSLVYAPAWAVAEEHRPERAVFSYPPENQADFARFVETAVRRYMPGGELARQQGWSDGYGATHYEIGHEHNVSRVLKQDGSLFFTGWLGDIDEYVDLLKTGHDALKGSCPSCLVLNGATTDGMLPAYGGRRDPTGVRQYLWQGVEDLYEAIQKRHPGDPNAADNYFDILNIHTYEWFMFSAEGKYPDLYRPYAYPDPLWYRDRLGNVTEVMARYGDADKEIWLTETTYPSTDDGDPLSGFLGEQGQADALRMAYKEASLFPQVKRVYWWYDYDVTYSLGLIRKDMSTKPSYDAFQELTGRKLP